ncbi:aliphatic sulfonate ABC transporter substrate-binding protein [Rhizobium sp. TRM95796]|uniref:aliphatic sulfonate ABC transporter substrate-binding protein n=1 Tax=Rhizobium sp. TRM95796 TaxID=2979862 RepID=UPI0021E731C1|nr:aliphatic sulfonate ABC transporter substrate-binding protein [Rhizobium sp. TRM95796]MCV3767827.1 aliphatic sulfonate ABC transporter substrate-binding protein [Rhizobium sp. TRM95796]
MINRRHTLKLAAAAGASTLFMGSGAAVRAAEEVRLRIGWQKFGILALAKSRGVLETRLRDRNVSIEWSEFNSGPPLLEALGANAVDFGPTGDVPPLFAQAAGGNLLYVGTYKPPAAFHGLLVKKDSPIQKIEDLKGRKVAYKRGSSAHNFAFKALGKVGLTPQDIESVDLPPPDAAAAFNNGSVDAWAIWDPFFAVAQSDPETRLLATSEGIVDAWGYFLGNGDFVAAHPELVVEILDELAKLGKAAQSDIDGTAKALSDITGVKEDITKATLTRAGSDLAAVATVSDAAIQYQQQLADDFYAYKVLPRQLTVSDIVWRPKQS